MTEKIVIDAENATMGRLASFSAKQALLGKEVAIVNVEKAIITGNRKDILETYKQKRRRHGSSLKGPIFSRDTEKIFKRTIRGMLSWKRGRGIAALDRIRCYKGVPGELESVKKIKAGKVKGNKFMKIEEVAELL